MFHLPDQLTYLDETGCLARSCKKFNSCSYWSSKLPYKYCFSRQNILKIVKCNFIDKNIYNAKLQEKQNVADLCLPRFDHCKCSQKPI